MIAKLTVVGLLVALSAGCSPPVTCGAGTRLVGAQCVAGEEPVDAGQPTDAGVDLPITAIIKPIAVLQGFAACPNVTVAFRDGRSASLILDPSYDIPVANTLRIDRAGFSLEWSSADGRAGTASLPGCKGAVTGLTPGMSTVSLVVKDGQGRSQTIGTAPVEVLPFSSGSVRGTRLVSPSTFPSTSESMLGTGERRPIRVELELAFPPSAPSETGALPLPSSLVIESSNPSVVTVDAAGEVLGGVAGTATLTARYQVAGQALPQGTSTITVSANQALGSIIFGLPRADSGMLLPDASRTLDVLREGECFTTAVYGVVQESSGSFLRTLDQVATITTAGSLQASGSMRFCPSSVGEGRVVACHLGTCGVFATVVTNVVSAPSLQATLTPNEFALGGFGLKRVCADLRVTATWGTESPQDVSTSAALRFARPFRTFVANPLSVTMDPATGLPLRQQGKVCFDVDVVAGQPDTAIRIFYAGAQTELTAKVHF